MVVTQSCFGVYIMNLQIFPPVSCQQKHSDTSGMILLLIVLFLEVFVDTGVWVLHIYFRFKPNDLSENFFVGLNIHIGEIYPPAITQAASAVEVKEEQKAAGCSFIHPAAAAALVSCSSQCCRATDTPEMKVCIAICRQLVHTAAQQDQEDLSLTSWD